MRSLNNKLDELSLLLRYDEDFRRSNLICLTETWLNDQCVVELPGYTTIRADRDGLLSGKSVGGGLLMFVDQRWATQFTIHERTCSKDYEILVVSFRPFYLPREFGLLTVMLVYVPGPNYKEAAEHITETYNSIVSRSADQPVFIMGDFNMLSLSPHLPTLNQYITCPTRSTRTLDLCFGNIEDAYKPVCRPPIGKSDHNVIHLLPKYRQLVKRVKPSVRTVQVWDTESEDRLKDCFDITNWAVFFDTITDPHELTDCITSYIQFCEQSVVSSKTVCVYANNKPWLTKELKMCLNEKYVAFVNADKEELHNKRRALRSKMQKAKLDFKNKVESRFCSGNPRQAWESLNIMMGRSKKAQVGHCIAEHSLSFVNDLNHFYSRFDSTDAKEKALSACAEVPRDQPIQLSEEDVGGYLSRVKPHKAPGPDCLGGRVLKVCSAQLKGVLTVLFQILLNTCTVPNSWKTSIIKPLPKKPGSKTLNNFRPVALTSVLAKCMERVVSKHLVAAVKDQLDPLQFAYRPCRGTEDATLTLINTVASHLQQKSAFVRILFIDLTSAFNTMRTDILIGRLSTLGVNGGLIHWFRDFLTDRPQRVNMNGAVSDEIIVNTGAPQGCVLSPVLFSLYINALQIKDSNVKLFKYADDMAIVGLFNNNVSCTYETQVHIVEQWCKQHSLIINVDKTKELILNSPGPAKSLSISDQPIEVVSSFKYLGTHIDEKLNFSQNMHEIYKKANQRLFMIRKLRGFGVSSQILERVYVGLIESVLVFNITVWFGYLTVANKNKLKRIVRNAGKVIGREQKSLDVLYQTAVLRMAKSISSDVNHPLFDEFRLMPSGRRYRMPLATKKVYKGSFVPNAVSLMNKH